MMKQIRPLSVYFTSAERDYLSRLAGHCCRSESEQVRWLVVEGYRKVFSDAAGRRNRNGKHKVRR